MIVWLLAVLLSGQAVSIPDTVPDAPGLYCAVPGGPHAVVGIPVLFHRSGSLLASTVTAGIVSQKVNIQIPGKHAALHLGPAPLFYYRPTSDEREGTVDLILARLKVYRDRRQLEATARGFGRESEGISINSQIQVVVNVATPGLYELVPAKDLDTGEYAFYLRTRGASTQDAYVYDFAVE